MKFLKRIVKGVLRRLHLLPRPAAVAAPEPAPAPLDAGASGMSYEEQIAWEKHHFDNDVNVHDLPDIFHYWSGKYLGPRLNQFGITDPEQFFFLYVCKFHERFPDAHIDIVSIGSGNADIEVRLARRLVDSGITRFTIDCLDINETMLARGRELAQAEGVAEHIAALEADFNTWTAQGKTYDVVIACHSLHHVVELEHLFAAIHECLNPEGYFLTADMIGRNGHMRWPEALTLVQEFWKELPEAYRYNIFMKRIEQEYINHDCSTEGFEGIRAQDILPLLVKRFHFELFIPFSNIVMVFIDRTFGHHFDAHAAWDQDFVDRLHARDEQGFLSGELKPTQMLAVLRKVPVATALVDPRLTPQFCVRDPLAP